MKLSTRLVLLLCIFISGVSVAARPKPGPPANPIPKGTGRYLLVLWPPGAPIPETNPPKHAKNVPPPDIAKAGGRVIHDRPHWKVIELPVAMASQLRKHEAVASIQRIWAGEEDFADWDRFDPAANADPRWEAASDADIDLTWAKSFEYDGSGNISSLGTDKYVYDAAGRLIRSELNGVEETFTYDAFGNQTSRSVENGTTQAIAIDPSTNRLKGAEYDVAGNTLRTAEATYEYDATGMMTSFRRSGTERRFIYDVNDERIGIDMVNGGFKWSIRDFDGRVLRQYRSEPLETSSGHWFWEQDYVYADGRLVAGEVQKWSYFTGVTWGGVRHYHLDHIGSVRLVTASTLSGRPKTVSEHDFFAFGPNQTVALQEEINWSAPLGPNIDSMRFAGHQRDFLSMVHSETNEYLDYMHARNYDPHNGRFLSVDPLLGQPFNPQSWNRYSYALNNPLNLTDPSGLKPCKVRLTGSDAEIAGVADGTEVDGECVEEKSPSAAEEAVDVAIETIDMTMFDLFSMSGFGNVLTGLYNNNPAQIAKGYGQQLIAASGGAAAALRPLAGSGSLVFAEGSALANASQAAFAAANGANAFSVSAKHLAGAGGRYAKFAADVNPTAVIQEGLQSGNAMFLPNGGGSFQVITNVGRVIGTRGETTIKIVVDYTGKIWTAYPIK